MDKQVAMEELKRRQEIALQMGGQEYKKSRFFKGLAQNDR
jgi:hypothetical protein